MALSVADGKPVWHYAQVGQGDSWRGTLTTAGGLPFFGDDAGSLEALEASTGRPLCHFNTGQGIRAFPMTYAIDDVQYVTVAVLRDVFTFALPH